MRDKIFVDSNVFLYLLSNDARKKDIAKTILKQRPTISTQVISENINVLFNKFKILTFDQVAEHVHLLKSHCNVCPTTAATIDKALELKAKYFLQWYDSTILSAAFLEGCSIIYSEDMQHNQLIEDSLKIINPFL